MNNLIMIKYAIVGAILSVILISGCIQEAGSVEIRFEPGSENLGRPLSIYDNKGDLVNEIPIMNISDVIIIDNLAPGEYVAKVENIGPPGTNEKEFTIVAGQVTKITLSVMAYV
jgi:hypothetical protein